MQILQTSSTPCVKSLSELSICFKWSISPREITFLCWQEGGVMFRWQASEACMTSLMRFVLNVCSRRLKVERVTANVCFFLLDGFCKDIVDYFQWCTVDIR